MQPDPPEIGDEDSAPDDLPDALGAPDDVNEADALDQLRDAEPDEPGP